MYTIVWDKLKSIFVLRCNFPYRFYAIIGWIAPSTVFNSYLFSSHGLDVFDEDNYNLLVQLTP